MAESQSVGTEAITALIAAILALANALDKKRRAFIRRISRCAFEHVSRNAARRCQRDAGHIFDGMLSQLSRAIRNRQKQTFARPHNLTSASTTYLRTFRKANGAARVAISRAPALARSSPSLPENDHEGHFDGCCYAFGSA